MDELYPLSVLSSRPNPTLSGRDSGAATMVVFLLVVDGDACWLPQFYGDSTYEAFSVRFVPTSHIGQPTLGLSFPRVRSLVTKFSPKILWFPQERFHFLARLHNSFGQLLLNLGAFGCLVIRVTWITE
jgi:hypothetical protein